MSKYARYAGVTAKDALFKAFKRIHGDAPKGKTYYVNVPKAARRGKTPEEIAALRESIVKEVKGDTHGGV
jgi:hypothetical protein